MKSVGLTTVKRVAVVVGSAFVVASAQAGEAVPVAQADSSCQALLQPLVSWLEETDGNQVLVTVATNQQSGLASYATGNLEVVNEPVPNKPVQTGVPTGGVARAQPSFKALLLTKTVDATEQFSDRWTTIPQGGPDTFGVGQNFSALAEDKLGVSIDSTDGATTFRLDSWGGGTYLVENPACAHGVMYGFANYSLGNNSSPTFVSFSFKEDYNPPPQ